MQVDNFLIRKHNQQFTFVVLVEQEGGREQEVQVKPRSFEALLMSHGFPFCYTRHHQLSFATVSLDALLLIYHLISSQLMHARLCFVSHVHVLYVLFVENYLFDTILHIHIYVLMSSQVWFGKLVWQYN